MLCRRPSCPSRASGRGRFIRPRRAKSEKRKVSPPWVGPTIVVCLVIGLAWIVVYYITQGSFPGMSALGSWNLVVGFVFIIAGVVLATTWREPVYPPGGELARS